MKNIALIGIFGVVGVLCRYGLDKSMAGIGQDFPVSTLVINIIGSFVAGLIFALSERHEISLSLQTGLLVGFCGGFTTFSAYALQTLAMVDKERFLPAITYFLLSPPLGLVAAFIPVLVLRKI